MAGLTVATAIGWGVWSTREPASGPLGPTDVITSLAVLPLDNSSGDPDQEYLSDGMTDTLRAELAKIRSVRVISRTSVMTYKDTARPRLPEIARALGVDAIVEGSVARAGDEVRVTAQLIRGVTDETLWAESYQRDISDVLSLQSEIARAIGREIQAVLSPDVEARLADRGPVDPDAYELTLRGHFYANQLSQETLERAIRYFEEAIEEDPAYAPAYAGLAFAYYSLSSVYVPPLDVMPLAREAATRAIELDPYLAAAHTWLGVVHLFFDYDWTAAERELRVAIDLDPSFAEARLGYGNYLLSVGRVEDAVTEVLAAEPLAPGSIVPYAHTMGSQWTAFMAQQYDLSIQKGREALTIDAGNAWAHAYLGIALVMQGAHAEGLAELREANRLEAEPMLQAFLAHGYAISGQETEARELLTQLEEFSRQEYLCAYEIGVTHEALGDSDEAIAWLQKARDDRADCIPYLGVDPRFDSLRSDPRFQALLDEIGFVTAR